ncbi:MAG: hypothetical protein QOK37_2409 [Thermoanaerobaculia bacterium]|jgi:hypothetical protein|nr:hypothetical protein [Thermoanaerobaculia bacterium]
MGKSEADVVAQLRSLGVDISGPEQGIEPEAIQALISGRKLTYRSKVVISARDRVIPPRPRPRPVAKQEPLAPPVERKSSTEISGGELLWALRQIAERERQQASNEVFIVHGHDNVRHAVAGFLSSLSLSPIMLDDKPNRGQTIIEKLEHHAFTSFAVVLLTPDDEGRKKGAPSLKSRPRQNVILELGYFLARLGRHRVCALYVPGVELPSDMHGVLYVELDDRGGWKYRLQQEMVAVGIPISVPS